MRAACWTTAIFRTLKNLDCYVVKWHPLGPGALEYIGVGVGPILCPKKHIGWDMFWNMFKPGVAKLLVPFRFGSLDLGKGGKGEFNGGDGSLLVPCHRFIAGFTSSINGRSF